MDKIHNLLEKSGCRAELVVQIVEALEQYRKSIQEQSSTELKAKIEQAKKVCVEETAAHKRDLSRRLQTFCEAKALAIENMIAKQAALNESAAVTKLKDIVNLLEGVKPDTDVQEIKKLRTQLSESNTKLAKAVTESNRREQIASKTLKLYRLTFAENQKLKGQVNTTVSEGRQATAETSRIDGSRNSARPVTARATLLENQSPIKPSQQRPARRAAQAPGAFSIADVAELVD